MTLANRIREFADKLDRVCVGRSTDMIDGLLRKPECGTPGCHAGWAAIALGEFNVGQHYEIGASSLEEFLGFEASCGESLFTWAKENDQFWGNERGRFMFCCGSSFGQSSEIFPAEVLSTHWRGVADRLDPPKKATETDLAVEVMNR